MSSNVMATGGEADGPLIERLCLGDLAAFEALYKSYRAKLRGFIRNIVANEEATDEVFDDVMMIVWNKISTFQGNSKLSTWIYAIAYRRALKERSKRVEVEYVDELHEPQLGSDLTEATIEKGRTQDLIKSALMQLPELQRTVVRLAYFEEMTYRDIGQIMECPEDTVKTRMFHARRKLKVVLGGSTADWV